MGLRIKNVIQLTVNYSLSVIYYQLFTLSYSLAIINYHQTHRGYTLLPRRALIRDVIGSRQSRRWFVKNWLNH